MLALLISLRVACSDVCRVLVRLVDNSDTCLGKQPRPLLVLGWSSYPDNIMDGGPSLLCSFSRESG